MELSDDIPNLPAHLPVPVAVVRHMPPVFTAQLADRLAGLSRLPVREAIAAAGGRAGGGALDSR